MAEMPRRKLTTVLSADVAGYSRLMNTDEVETFNRLMAYRKTMAGFIERHHGRVVNTAGDSLLAEFDSVVEAVQCAAEIQRELGTRNAEVDDAHQMLLRVGIHLGDVMVEGTDLYGEGVNIAARLQSLADPGGIYLSGAAYEQVRNKLTLGYDFIGKRHVKNIAEEVLVYRVLLDAAAARARHDASSAPPSGGANGSGESSTTAPDAAGEAKTARRVYLLFVLSLLLGLAALLVGGPGETAFFGGAGGEIDGDALFTRNATFRGKIGGDAVVAPGVHVRLGGEIDGDLILGPQAVAEVDGKIDGDVINHGGQLRLRGKLSGTERYAAPETYAGPPASQTADGSADMASADAPNQPNAPAEAPFSRAPALALRVLFAITLITAVIVAYVHRGDGTSWVDSHYHFQIRTFWLGLVAIVAGGVTTLVGIGLIVLLLLPFWLLLRCLRGWRYLAHGQPHPKPGSWLLG